jgi:hypothetical protein
VCGQLWYRENAFSPAFVILSEPSMNVVLQHVAHLRSGDKGDISNIAVFAYSPALYPILKAQLSAQAVSDFYRGTIKGEVIRYEVDNLEALNFVCHGALGGGVSRSLSLDNYGKALGAALLGFELDVPETLLADLVGYCPVPKSST